MHYIKDNKLINLTLNNVTFKIYYFNDYTYSLSISLHIIYETELINTVKTLLIQLFNGEEC